MSLRGEDALILAMDYTEQTLKGQGALKGEDGFSPVITENTNTGDVYKLDITTKDGKITTPNLVGKQGIQGEIGPQGKPADNPIVSENADNTDEIYKLDLTVGETVFTTRNIQGKQGLEGVSPSVTTNPDNTAEDYRLNITTKGGTFTTPNLRGPIGPQGEQGESAASAINPRGDYDVNADPHYTLSDYITSAEGNTYVCKKDNPSNVAPTDGTVNDEFWQILALRGAQGLPGKDGEKGADGVTFTPSIDENGILSFTNNGGLENPNPIDIKGDNGVTFTPSIDAEGYLSFTNNGNLENPEPIKVLGQDGADGKDGIDGTTYIPSIGTVTTVESNTDASAGVTVDQETKEAVFHFEIPKGEKAIQFTPSITENGELAWENDGDLPNPPTTPIQTLISTAPLGTVLSFAGSNAPNGYLLCDGKSYAVADYSDLYAVIGNTYGGDSTNFNVPNLVDKFIQGSNTSGTEKEAGLPNITGSIGNSGSANDQFLSDSTSAGIKTKGALSITGYASKTSMANGSDNYNTPTGFGFDASKSNAIYGKSNTVQPPALTMVYIIKAYHTNEGQDEGVSDSVIEYVEGEIAEVESELNTLTKMEQGMTPLGEMYFNDTPYKKLTAKIVYGRTMVFDVVGGKGKYFGKIFVYQADTATPIVRVVDICGARPFDLKYDNLANTDKSGFYTLDLFIYKSLWDGTLVFKPSSQASFYSSNLYTTSDFVNCTETDYDNAKGTSIYETLNPLNDSATNTTSTWSSSKIASEIVGKKTQYRGSRSIDISTGGNLTLIYSSEYASQAGCYMLLSNYNTTPLLIELGRTNIGAFNVTATNKSFGVDTITVTTAGDEYSWYVLQF